MKLKSLIVIILILFINILFFNINVVQAEGFSDVISGGDSFINAGTNGNMDIDRGKLQDTSKTLNSILILIGMCVAVVVSAILGIKFMIGSVEEKAQIKEALIPFIIGCIVVFGAFGIWRIFITVGNDFDSSKITTNRNESATHGGEYFIH